MGVFDVHGSVEAVGDSFIATTGSGMVRIDAADGGTDELDPRAEKVHLMSFGLDQGGSVAYISACGDPPSVNRLDLETNRVHVMPSGQECGDLLGVAAGRYAALAVAPGGGVEGVDPQAVRLRQIDLQGRLPSAPLGDRAPQAVLVETGDAAP